MEWETIADFASKALAKPLFKIAGTEITLSSITLLIIILIFAWIASLLIQRAISKSLKRRFEQKEGTLAAINRLSHYSVIIIGMGIGLQTIGINMSALFAAGAVFAVAVGFAMQNVAQNFVSGIILLVERSIKPGDIIEVEGNVVKVIEMGIRTTIVRTWKDEDLILPNSIFSQSTVKNFTLRDNNFRLGIMVGVTYDSDMDKVIKVLHKVATDIPWGLKIPEPAVMLQEFGSSSVDFGVYISINDPWKQRLYKAELRLAVWNAFKQSGIVIAFPQLDVHFDKPLTEALTDLRKIV